MAIAPFDTVTCVLQWDDPFGGAANDYDLFVFDDAMNVLDSGTSTQDGTQDPLEFVVAGNPTAAPKPVKVAIERVAGADRTLKMFCLGGLAQEYVTPAGSIIGHAALSEKMPSPMNVTDPGLTTSSCSACAARRDLSDAGNSAEADLVAFDGVTISTQEDSRAVRPRVDSSARPRPRPTPQPSPH
jgi:hypothetical protein